MANAMKVFLVRHIETKEFQGIFWGDAPEIWDIFDEIGDPFGFEYAAISAGGIYTQATIGEGQKWGREIDWSAFESSERLGYALFDDGLTWTPFDPTDVGHGALARIVRSKAGGR